MPVFRCLISDWRPVASMDGQNARLHWAARHKRTSNIHSLIAAKLAEADFPRSLGGLATVTLRVTQARGPLPDSDGVQAMLKSTRDAIARWFEVDDGPTGPVTWEYSWVRGPDSVEIVLEVL